MDDFWTSAFWRDLNEGDINFRDNLQFELKSKFPIQTKTTKNSFIQELFLFIPETLQIDPYTYLKDFFYMDQTNLIRYQTPILSIKELINPNQKNSPFYHLKFLINQPLTRDIKHSIVDEMQLLATVFRSALRKRVRSLILDLQKEKHDTLEQKSLSLGSEIKSFRDYFFNFKKESDGNEQIAIHMTHVEEYLIDTIEYYLTGFLDRLKHFHIENTGQKEIIDLLIEMRSYRKVFGLEPKESRDSIVYQESILYRSSLLNKFVMESLKLDTNRIALQEKYGHALGGIAAGIAMFIYLTLFAIALFAHKGSPFIFTSFPIILIAVVLYILKDRVKESLKLLMIQKAFRWFPDYTTKIKSPKGHTLGILKETFSFIREKDLPDGFLQMRNEQFHDDLSALKRHESIIKYKREVFLYPHSNNRDERRNDLNTIFRFNVHRFIQKANDSLQTHLKLDHKSLKIIHDRLPKVYHLNIIIRNTYTSASGKPSIEVDKFRVVIDKTGIKRVEKL